ncbi:Hypothetical_protein [Hexamita inflata]|uniref:Hypothetical_protein n=1 Tax=Hexamita inflata TaxID=28002 RepID=A0AA86TAY5_9EUKA|nr:Hypothetical protein HINF_LOCUS691 [Hexamita inflata]CAI9956755.1 Hypothetical protein HINF_LOCUS44400 [Hexamita inflata]
MDITMVNLFLYTLLNALIIIRRVNVSNSVDFVLMHSLFLWWSDEKWKPILYSLNTVNCVFACSPDYNSYFVSKSCLIPELFKIQTHIMMHSSIQSINYGGNTRKQDLTQYFSVPRDFVSRMLYVSYQQEVNLKFDPVGSKVNIQFEEFKVELV